MSARKWNASAKYEALIRGSLCCQLLSEILVSQGQHIAVLETPFAGAGLVGWGAEAGAKLDGSLRGTRCIGVAPAGVAQSPPFDVNGSSVNVDFLAASI